MKRTDYDYMSGEDQVWEEPLVDMFDRFDRERAKTLGIIAVVMVLCSLAICAALYSMATRPLVDTEQAALVQEVGR